MTNRKHQIGIILRPILLLFTLMILLQAMENARVSAPLLQPALPVQYHGMLSPAVQPANPFCPVRTCHQGLTSAQCPCSLRHTCFIAGNSHLMNMDILCQGQPEGNQSIYRFIKTETWKKRLKRAVRRLLRLKPCPG
ncbi:hypothetical protein ACL2XP_07630 [Sodalis sp. RH21]|uniref:hypothetical protein n=1 Tax=unclassified Sodalis (in: enterobacteria) TaxID=2636512 RepID=UPI0039B4ED0F